MISNLVLHEQVLFGTIICHATTIRRALETF